VTYDSASADRPEIADVGRLARRLMRRAVRAARADEASIGRLLTQHLGTDATEWPVATRSWAAYDQVNVQTAVDAWLAAPGPGRTHRLVGLTDYQHREFGLSELLRSSGEHWSAGVGSPAMDALPAGPDGVTLACVQCAVYLTTDQDGPAALLVRGPEEHGRDTATVQVASDSEGRAQEILAEIQRLSIERNVFRGHVIAFGDEVFGHRRGTLLSFTDRPEVARDQVILPPDLLDGIERQVVGVARHAAQLLASGQHLRRGVLLYGKPGTGKTHTLRYLLGRLPGITCILLSGGSLRMIAEACSVARALQPSVVVVEDVDLIAEERTHMLGRNPLLFQLLNEMDGLSQDADVTFLLTTNRADLLEAALAARPGRIDHAAELPLPDADARARLIRLYQGSLEMASSLDTVVARTDGVTASFIKELLRRAALAAAEEIAAVGADDGPLRVTDAHLTAALDQLLGSQHALTTVLLGGAPGSAAAAAEAGSSRGS
jgi:hypothetical protein